MSDHLSNSELKRWAAVRADDAGRLSREVLAFRARVAKLEAVRSDLANLTTEDCPEGLQYVLIRGFSAMGYALPIEAANAMLTALKDTLNG